MDLNNSQKKVETTNPGTGRRLVNRGKRMLRSRSNSQQHYAATPTSELDAKETCTKILFAVSDVIIYVTRNLRYASI